MALADPSGGFVPRLRRARLRGVNPAFGTDADLRAFIDAAHARGIRVYLDYVLNHTGKDHPWFKSAAASEGSPYRDRYIFSEDPQADIAAGRIDQIATEGAAGYDAGQWFSTDTGAGAAGRFKFVLDWTNADSPTVTVTETTDAADADIRRAARTTNTSISATARANASTPGAATVTN